MTRAATCALTAVLVLFLVGCKTNVTVDLHFADLDGVAASGDKNRAARVVMAIRIPSDSECGKYTAKAVQAMAGVVKDFTPRGCTSKRKESYLLGEVQAPLVAGWKPPDALFRITVTPQWVWLAMDTDKFKAVRDRMRKEFNQALKVGESTVTVMLHNDGRQAQRYGVMGALVDGQPVVGFGDFELKRRARAKVELSNVASLTLAKGGRVPVLTRVVTWR